MKGKILLIEDNEQNRYLTTFLLDKSGYEVISAYSGETGIELAKQTLPRLILLDIQLPAMDGYSVARAFKNDPVLSGIPIVAVTSYAMSGDREKAMEAGCIGYIEKPINPETFVSDMERYIP